MAVPLAVLAGIRFAKITSSSPPRINGMPSSPQWVQARQDERQRGPQDQHHGSARLPRGTDLVGARPEPAPVHDVDVTATPRHPPTEPRTCSAGPRS
jgi:hypothetical protein